VIEDLHKLLDIKIPVTLVEGFVVKLPLISKYLIQSWVDNSLVMEKAGKLDDAEVPTHPWAQRIAKVLDVPIPVINTVRKWLFKCYYCGLLSSLSAFLCLCHGSDWALQLMALCRQEHFRTNGGAIARFKCFQEGKSFYDLG
jgi:hypothetical protein